MGWLELFVGKEQGEEGRTSRSEENTWRESGRKKGLVGNISWEIKDQRKKREENAGKKRNRGRGEKNRK